MSKPYDLIVIGSGPAGQKAAIQAAKINKRVAIIERGREIGGVAVHTGTIPSKTLREAVLYLSGYDQRGLYGKGYRLKQEMTMDDLMQRVAITINQEVDVMSHQLQRNGVKVIQGIASFADQHCIRVESRDGKIVKYKTDKVMLATGTRPRRPDSVSFDGEVIVDSDEILSIKKLPRTMTVVGAGVIGIEYASIFSAMDIKVTIVDSRNSMMRFMDREITDELVHMLRERGVIIRLGESIDEIIKKDNQAVINLKSGKKFSSDLVLFAAGRIGCTSSLKLENAGLESDEQHRIKVNEYYQTEVENIYAAGDLIGFPSLASTSMEQGRL
ncbi:MAG: FAD-dependent oxidoreductase, partial [Gammaproteobacteria bacterium]|nr:FAD-dependent oxidoreductase [Gammaproteobacteria bacterium]